MKIKIKFHLPIIFNSVTIEGAIKKTSVMNGFLEKFKDSKFTLDFID